MLRRSFFKQQMPFDFEKKWNRPKLVSKVWIPNNLPSSPSIFFWEIRSRRNQTNSQRRHTTRCRTCLHRPECDRPKAPECVILALRSYWDHIEIILRSPWDRLSSGLVATPKILCRNIPIQLANLSQNKSKSEREGERPGTQNVLSAST